MPSPMYEPPWVRAPVGTRERHWSTRIGCKSVLVMVPHVVAGTRLLDLLPLLESDHRVQVVFTVAEPIESWSATHAFVESLGGVVLPWVQARSMSYDLVLAGSLRGVDDVSGPVLLVPHGGGFAQYRRWRPSVSDGGQSAMTNLASERLVRDGRVRVDALVLTNEAELAVLRQTCPPAVPHAVVAGNIAFERMLASTELRDQYREAFDPTSCRKLVVVSSTWSDRSAFGRHPDLFDRVMAELPPEEYAVVGLLHPSIWSHHGAWQVRSWLAHCLRNGLVLVRPERGWQAALIAADHVMGDYGSVTAYAAGLGKPVLLTDEITVPVLNGSPTALLIDCAPRWRTELPLAPQLTAQELAHSPAAYADLRTVLTAQPGQAAPALRRTMYGLMSLAEPDWTVATTPVQLPALVRG